MNPKKIGLLFGMERSFPDALTKRISELSGGKVVAEPVSIDVVRLDQPLPYDLILDRISQDVPFYRTVLKFAAQRGTEVINNPFWWTAEDKFCANAIGLAAGVAIPKTILLPHKAHPAGTKAESFSNLKFPLSWGEIFKYLGFPIFLKPAFGGGWKNVYKVNNEKEFFEKYDQTGDLTMLAQEAIQFESYYRCYVIGREKVHIMRYDPSKPYLQNYVADEPPLTPELKAKIERDAKALCEALGHDMNTVEFALRKGVPIAIDFTNPAPDADIASVGKANFEWVVQNMAEFLIKRVQNPRPLSLAGNWPSLFPAPTASNVITPVSHTTVAAAIPVSASATIVRTPSAPPVITKTPGAPSTPPAETSKKRKK
ncbi:MAG: RimK family alpha-L-glutamate ligase [Planctomycetota bacterium]